MFNTYGLGLGSFGSPFIGRDSSYNTARQVERLAEVREADEHLRTLANDYSKKSADERKRIDDDWARRSADEQASLLEIMYLDKPFYRYYSSDIYNQSDADKYLGEDMAAQWDEMPRERRVTLVDEHMSKAAFWHYGSLAVVILIVLIIIIMLVLGGVNLGTGIATVVLGVGGYYVYTVAGREGALHAHLDAYSRTIK